jgi:hypothetical protein
VNARGGRSPGHHEAYILARAQLRGALATLYGHRSAIRRVVSDTFLRPETIDLHGSAETIWYSVIEEAEKHGHLHQLVRVALDEYPNHRPLIEAAALLDVIMPRGLTNWTCAPPSRRPCPPSVRLLRETGRLPRSTLRALRSVVARAAGLRRSLVRVKQVPCPYPHAIDNIELVVRTPGDRWSVDHDPTPAGARRACRQVQRRADNHDLP